MSDTPASPPQGDTQTTIQLSETEMLLNNVLKIIQTTDADALLTQAVQAVLDITGAERGVLLLLDSEGKPEVKASVDADEKFLHSGHAKRVFTSIVTSLSETHECKMSSNVQEDTNYKPSDSLFGITLRSVLGIPMLNADKLVGVIYVEQTLRKGPFERLNLNLNVLQSLASIVTITHTRLIGE